MSRHAIVRDNISCLDEAVRLLDRISDATYTEPRRAFFNASVGGHIRHNIDHYRNFLGGLADGRIDYESRERDPGLEDDRFLARSAILTLIEGLDSLHAGDLDAPCSVRVNTDTDDTSDPDHWSGSTIRRELQFLLGHAIHHHAQVAAMCRLDGFDPEPAFGMAPSTLRHRAQARELASGSSSSSPPPPESSSCAR